MGRFKMINRSDSLLLTIFITVILSIFIKVIFDSSGYLSNDSTNYLYLAQNIIDGHGFYVTNEIAKYEDRVLFSTWPIGYSSLIAIVSTLSGLTVFISSKILNVIFIGCIILIFRKLFETDAWIYALIFFYSSYLEIFCFTWSETGFIFGLVMFSYFMHKFLNNKANTFSLVVLLFTGCFLFLIRYIGAFTIGFLGLLWIYLLVHHRNDKKRIITVSIIIMANILFVSIYLYYNYLETGLMTGIERFSASESNYELLVQLLTTLLAEITIPVYHPRPSFIIPMLFIQIALIIYYNYKKKFLFKRQESDYKYSVSRVFFMIGILYLTCIILVRWFFYFSPLSFRLLGPGTFLIFISLISYLSENMDRSSFNDVKKIIMILSIISLILYVPVKTYFRYQQSYNDTLIQIDNKYGFITKGSVLSLVQNKHLKYLRSDIIIKTPVANEGIYEFYNRVNGNHEKKVFIEISENGRLDRYDKSFSDLFLKHKNGEIVELFQE
jgi:hypothetical protein